MSKVGFIGLGIMGKPMAKHLLDAGHELFVNDVVKAPVDELVASGAKEASRAEIGACCDVLFLSVPNGAISQDILFGKDGVCTNIRPELIVCDTSSVTPGESKTCAERLAQYGVRFMDAPVSGGEEGAINGTLAMMCGGDAETFALLQPYFEILGRSAVLIGGVGSGSVTKLANQIIVNNTIAIVSEALVLATKAGADPEKVFEAIRGGLAGSQVLNDKAPRMFNRSFIPGGSLTINHKDIKNVLSAAHELDVPVPYSAQLFEIMQTLKLHGHMWDDHAGIVQYFEMLAGIEVQSDAYRAAHTGESSSGERS